MEELIYLSEDFLDSALLEGAECEDDYIDEDVSIDEVIDDDDEDMEDIKSDYETYSECEDFELDFDHLLEAEEIDINVNLFSEAEEIVGLEDESYFRFFD